MTHDERQQAASAIAEYDRLSAQRATYAELHRIIDEWDFYQKEVDRALACLIGNEEDQSDLLADLLLKKPTREALFSAIKIVIEMYDKEIEAI